MLEERIFGSALFLGSLLFIFHGGVLLITPGRYLPLGGRGESTLRLVRKPPFEFWKRFFGLCLSVAVLLIFTLPGISIILNPGQGALSFGASPLPPGSKRWDMLGIALIALASGYALLFWPERSVIAMFSSDERKLEDKTTKRLWILYVQVAGWLFLVWCLLPLGEFIKSLR
jgi:hypothetical protein